MAAAEAKRARRQEEKNRSEVEEEQRRRDNLFNLRYHQDMTDRTEVQGMLRELREANDAQKQQDDARSATLGETNEMKIANEQNRNKSMADAVAGIASNASMLKDSALDKYENSLENYYKQRRDVNTRMAQIAQNTSNQWGQAANNALGVAGAMAGVAAGAADGSGAGGKWTPKNLKTSAATVGNYDMGGGVTVNQSGVYNKYNPFSKMGNDWAERVRTGIGYRKPYGFGGGFGIR